MAESLLESIPAQLEAASAEKHDALARAADLEAEAQTLRIQAPRQSDAAIHQAIGQFMTAVSKDSLTPRDTLALTLAINQYLPSNVIGRHSTDAPGILAGFDAMAVGGTPAIINTWHQGGALSRVVISDELEPEVSVEEARGMGGLPMATILFSAFNVSGSPEAPQVASKATPLEVTFHELEASAIGATGVQSYVDKQRVAIRNYTCGHNYSSNENAIRRALASAQLAAAAGGFSLDLTSIEAELQIADNRRKQRDGQRSRASLRRRF